MRNEMSVKTADKQVNLSLLVRKPIFMFQKDEQLTENKMWYKWGRGERRSRCCWEGRMALAFQNNEAFPQSAEHRLKE